MANALVHRTWDVRSNVQIALYDDRIRRAYQGSLIAPIFDLRGGFVTVTLPVVDAFEGTDDERSILRALGGGRVLTRRAIEEETHLGRGSALAALGSLVEKGLVTRGGEGRATRYARP